MFSQHHFSTRRTQLSLVRFNQYITFSLLLFLNYLTTPAVAAAELSKTSTGGIHRFNRDGILGTTLEIKLIANTDQQAKLAYQNAIKEIERLTAVYSSYTPDSECSKLSNAAKDKPQIVSREMLTALKMASQARKMSSGKFTVFSTELTQLWKQSATDQTKPSQDTLKSVCSRIARAEKQLILNIPRSTVTLGPETKDLQIGLNAIAKGIVIDASLYKIMSTPGISSAMVNIGGDIACKGGGLKWPVHIPSPISSEALASIPLTNSAIATSGHNRRFYTIKGQQYSHIIDASSGLPVTEIISSTVIAPTAGEADMLATLFCLVDVDTALKIIDKRPKSHAMLVDKNETVHQSKDWPTTSGDTKSNEAPITISFDQNFSGNGKKKDRHYTVVWVENDQGEKVKDILLWHKMKKRKYLKTLKTWWKKGGSSAAKDLEFLKTISEATKREGSYSLTWDHTDNRNTPLEEAEYTINIEVNREDGPSKEKPTHCQVKIDTRNKNILGKGKPQPELSNVQIKR